jgi:hypothetical protein
VRFGTDVVFQLTIHPNLVGVVDERIRRAVPGHHPARPTKCAPGTPHAGRSIDGD